MIITEAGQSLANSIKLYELGYFDDAYYSMRSAIELATIMLDVGDNEYEKMVDNMNLFSTKEYRNFRSSTLRYLKEYSQQATAQMLGLTQVKVSREEKKIFEALRKKLT